MARSRSPLDIPTGRSQKQMKKVERTARLFNRIHHALHGHECLVERSTYSIAISSSIPAGGYRAIEAEYIGGAWQLYRRWSECPVAGYGEDIPGEAVEAEAKVVILVKRWLLQGLT